MLASDINSKHAGYADSIDRYREDPCLRLVFALQVSHLLNTLCGVDCSCAVAPAHTIDEHRQPRIFCSCAPPQFEQEVAIFSHDISGLRR